MGSHAVVETGQLEPFRHVVELGYCRLYAGQKVPPLPVWITRISLQPSLEHQTSYLNRFDAVSSYLKGRRHACLCVGIHEVDETAMEQMGWMSVTASRVYEFEGTTPIISLNFIDLHMVASHDHHSPHLAPDSASIMLAISRA
ncbi:hypothetical protein Hypma_003501 [Hypsizygus marmoreus]|uniref:Uncharacterized protein n=1 Tax=Hypsizygus marmoreus TaxID=39966 RepID=A0A369J1Q1_HYPMA|nr:hypothetical protein Hypma_003501 [Hypsizygus marmoreus]